MYACSPQWPADWIDKEHLEKGLEQLAGRIQPSPWGSERISLNHGLHFSGGEPFLNFDLLLRAVEVAEELRIPSTFVETNCFWCTTDEIAREKLRVLQEAGLRGILISVNPFYAEFVPFERTERAVRLSLEIFEDNVFVYQQEYWRQFREMGIRERLPLEEYVARTGHTQFIQHTELFLMGRAPEVLRDSFSSFPAGKFFHVPCVPPFLRDWHNHFDNYGNLLPGYCGGLSLGDWRNLDKVLAEGIDGEVKPVLWHLATDDVAGLFRFGQDWGYQESAAGYVSKCHLCLDRALL